MPDKTVALESENLRVPASALWLLRPYEQICGLMVENGVVEVED